MSIVAPSGLVRRVRVLVALLLLALAQVGFPGTLPAPKLRAGRFVYRISGGFVPDKLSEHGFQEIQQAAGRLHYPFYVVFVEQLPTETGSSTDDDTERAIVGLAEDWARDPKFNRNRATLFLVSYGPGDRKYKMLPAPLWRTELGLEHDALLPYTNIFRSHARQDPQSAITRMMAAFDAYVFDNFDPARKAQKAEALRREREAARVKAAKQAAQARRQAELDRVEAAKRQVEMGRRQEQARVEAARQQVENRFRNAQYRLSDAMSRLDEALRASPDQLPSDLESYRSNLTQAARVRQGGRVEALESWSGQLLRDLSVLDEYAGRRRAEQAALRARQSAIVGAILVGVALVLGAVAFRWRGIRRDQEKVRQRVATWRDWITQARQRYFLFDENRERAPHLRAFGGRTGELYQSTSKEIDAIIIGVEAVATLLDSAEAKAKRTTFQNRAPLDEALAALDKPVTFATDRISEKLFEPAEATIEITPSAFLTDLSARYDAAVQNWQALNEAVTRSLELPDALFPHIGLDALLERAHGHEIPERWLVSHPLMGDAVADQDLYAKVNECRLTDPYAYALQIEDLRAREARLTSDLERLIEAIAVARSRRIDAVSGLADTVLHPDDDPQITLDSANHELKRVTEMLATADSVEAVEAQAQTVDELYRKAGDQIAVAQEAIVRAPVILKQAGVAYGDCQALEGRSSLRAEQVARDHADVSAVRNAHGAAKRYIDAGARDFARAEAKFQERRHLGAGRDAQQSLEQFAHATAQMHTVLDMCAELDAMKARYEQRLLEMERLARDAQSRVRRYNGSPHIIGDFLSPRLHAGPSDYGYLLGLLQHQENEWNAAVRRAEREYEEEQRRRREAEEDERRRRQESLFSSSSSSSSHHSSFSSGSSGGSFGSSSSSSSDSGSSGGSW